MAFDEVRVETEQRADALGHPIHQLHMQHTARDIVILHEAEHLRLAGVAIVCRQIHDLFHIAHERWTR